MLLLDTHIWIWWVTQTYERLNANVLNALKTADSLAISAVSIYELSVLAKRQRITLTLPVDEWLTAATQEGGIDVLSITRAVAQRAGKLESVHGDPIDRMIMATALIRDIQLVSIDNVFSRYIELKNHLLS